MKKLLIAILCYSLLSYSDYRDDDKIYKNYCKAIDSYGSTYQNYLVVKIQDKSNGKLTEICLTGFELISTMTDEWGYNIDDEFKVVKKVIRNKKRVFKVKNANELKHLKRIKYSQIELSNYSKQVNFDSIVKSISDRKKWSYFAKNEKEQIMIAHLLFNKGFLTGINECFGGDELEYYAK